MAVDIGTLTGTISIKDESGAAFASVSNNLTAVGTKFDALTTKSTAVYGRDHHQS